LVADYPFSRLDVDKVVPISDGTRKLLRNKKGKAI